MAGTRDRFRMQMLELRARQNSRATAASLISGIEVKELAAVRKLARDTWGPELSSLDIPQPGVMRVGFFHSTADRHLPPGNRAQTSVAVGRTHREIAEQVRLWRATH